jgi:hypothetical protein
MILVSGRWHEMAVPVLNLSDSRPKCDGVAVLEAAL